MIARLQIVEIDQVDAVLHLQVENQNAASVQLPDEVPNFLVRLDGERELIRVEASRAALKPDAASWVALPIDRLPVGQFELTLQAFGSETTVALQKSADGLVTSLPLEERRGVEATAEATIIPIDPSAILELQ